MMFTRYKLLYFYLIIFHFHTLEAVIAVSTTPTSEYFKAPRLNNLVQNVTKAIKARSLIQCAAACFPQNCNCFSFDKQLQTCDIGVCESTNSHSNASKYMYFTCNSKTGFTLLTSGSLRSCVWVSYNRVSYITARDDCKARSSHLYTLKTMDKLTLLRNTYNVQLWVGLNNMDNEDIFRWVDDNSVCDRNCIQQLFGNRPPDNFNGTENCVEYMAADRVINVKSCADKLNYICEKPFFNFP